LKIQALKNGKLEETDRLEIARLLIKAGYTVKIGREKQNTKSSIYTHYIEFNEEEKK
jgi:hypothetical protein